MQIIKIPDFSDDIFYNNTFIIAIGKVQQKWMMKQQILYVMDQ